MFNFYQTNIEKKNQNQQLFERKNKVVEFYLCWERKKKEILLTCSYY